MMYFTPFPFHQGRIVLLLEVSANPPGVSLQGLYMVLSVGSTCVQAEAGMGGNIHRPCVSLV